MADEYMGQFSTPDDPVCTAHLSGRNNSSQSLEPEQHQQVRALPVPTFSDITRCDDVVVENEDCLLDTSDEVICQPHNAQLNDPRKSNNDEPVQSKMITFVAIVHYRHHVKQGSKSCTMLSLSYIEEGEFTVVEQDEPKQFTLNAVNRGSKAVDSFLMYNHKLKMDTEGYIDIWTEEPLEAGQCTVTLSTPTTIKQDENAMMVDDVPVDDAESIPLNDNSISATTFFSSNSTTVEAVIVEHEVPALESYIEARSQSISTVAQDKSTSTVAQDKSTSTVAQDKSTSTVAQDKSTSTVAQDKSSSTVAPCQSTCTSITDLEKLEADCESNSTRQQVVDILKEKCKGKDEKAVCRNICNGGIMTSSCRLLLNMNGSKGRKGKSGFNKYPRIIGVIQEVMQKAVVPAEPLTDNKRLAIIRDVLKEQGDHKGKSGKRIKLTKEDGS